MKIIEKYPPNFEIIQLALNPPKHAIYCYGDTIYNPSKRKIDQDIIHHEEVHSKQQDNNPDLWYTKYIQDKEFRLDQELEAYSSQYIFNKKIIGGKLLRWRLEQMAKALSSDYKLGLSFNEAISKIRNYGK